MSWTLVLRTLGLSLFALGACAGPASSRPPVTTPPPVVDGVDKPPAAKQNEKRPHISERRQPAAHGAAPHSGAHSQQGDHDHTEAHQHQHQHYSFSDVERYAKMFDDPGRDAWQKPQEVVQLLELAPGMVVADIGAGTGYFLRYLSLAVEAAGRVLALDVEPAMVHHMQARAKREQLANVVAKTVSASSAGLAKQSVDRILVVNTWHHITGRVAYARELRDALRPQGKLAIVDFTLEAEIGPPRPGRLAPSRVSQELEQAGFRAVVAEESLANQYVVVATVP